jgi:hypothetical protein
MPSRIPGKLKLRDLSRLSPEYDEVIALSKALLQPQHPITTAILGADWQNSERLSATTIHPIVVCDSRAAAQGIAGHNKRQGERVVALSDRECEVVRLAHNICASCALASSTVLNWPLSMDPLIAMFWQIWPSSSDRNGGRETRP